MHKPSEPVTVERYNPEWVSWFEQLCSFFEPRLAPHVIKFEHVGSTAIPKMIAKSIIDFDIVIQIADFDEIRSRLESIGYVHQGDLGIPEREAFSLEDIDLKGLLPPHHLYVCYFHSKELHRHIAFRDYLCNHPADAREYSKLKQSLVDKYKGDRESYIAGKNQLVREILDRALSWYEGKNSQT
ncbi:MAG: GrpB family protein [Candidatus Thorarchaeota archaeon]|jgi:GrpB-like predicted nucleotidyltransferase (UPF0157 family)